VISKGVVLDFVDGFAPVLANISDLFA